jgi:DNA-binding CsgD family transcriptional regulator/sugar-specific transcriptional regulator TrmB
MNKTYSNSRAWIWHLLGLEERDESVYRHDVMCPGSSTREASRATGLPEEVINLSRDRLIAVGLLRIEPSGEVRAIPNGPAALTEQLQIQLEAEHARKRSDLMKTESELTRLINEQFLASRQAGSLQVDRIPSRDAANVRITELMCNAQDEVVRLDPGSPKPSDGRTDPTILAEIKASRRGVSVRTICSPTHVSDPFLRRSLDCQVDADIRIRVMSSPDISMIIVDRRVAVLTDHRRVGNRGALLVRDGLLVYTLRSIFETWWVQATDLGFFLVDSETRPFGEVTGEERAMLHLLGCGYKDETVAKTLGISVRTVRRKVSDVQRRMPASSRFQAGVRAARRGWV